MHVNRDRLLLVLVAGLRLLAVGLIATIGHPQTAAGQSLGELARQVRAWRATLTTPSPLYTLKGDAVPQEQEEEPEPRVVPTPPPPQVIVIERIPERSSERYVSTTERWNRRFDRPRDTGMPILVGYGYGPFLNQFGGGIKPRHLRRNLDSSRQVHTAPVAAPAPHTPPLTTQSPRVQNCLSARGTWANSRCLP